MIRQSRFTTFAAALALTALVACVQYQEDGDDTFVVAPTPVTTPSPAPSPSAAPTSASSCTGGQCTPANSVRTNPFGYGALGVAGVQVFSLPRVRAFGGAVDLVRVTKNLAPCPSNPTNSSGLLPLGCVAFVTTTPKLADGTDQPYALHACATPSWRVVVGDPQTVRIAVQPNQPFNADVSWVAGTRVDTVVTIEAEVCGVRGSWTARATA